jgi:hypothetical protein
MAEQKPSPEVTFEHQQIAARIGWYASFQSFMFIAFVGNAGQNFIALPKWCIPLAGIVSSILTLLGIAASIIRLVEYKARFDFAGIIALAYPTIMPVVLSALWIFTF